jgi:hypothetical protein
VLLMLLMWVRRLGLGMGGGRGFLAIRVVSRGLGEWRIYSGRGGIVVGGRGDMMSLNVGCVVGVVGDGGVCGECILVCSRSLFRLIRGYDYGFGCGCVGGRYMGRNLRGLPCMGQRRFCSC